MTTAHRRGRALREHWDRAAFYTVFGGYGAASIAGYQGRTMVDSPLWVAYPVYALFMLSAALLAYGWFTNRAGPYVAGNVLGVLAVTAIACAVLALSASAGSLLVVAVGLAMVIMLRRTRRENRMLDKLRAEPEPDR